MLVTLTGQGKGGRLPRHETSISDIARAAGVSHPTVSRALRDSPLISAAVRERIQRLAQEMGYTPNAIAQSLQTRRSNTIGLVVTSIADPFLGDVVKGVEAVAHAANISVFLSTSSNDPDQEMAIIETFHRRRVDGILVAASRITSNYKGRLDRIKVPTVLINSQAESQYKSLYWVSVDDRKGAQFAVEHLLRLGHCSIGYLGVESRPKSNQQRLEGYQQALAGAGVSYLDTLVEIAPSIGTPHEEDLAAGQALLSRLLDVGVTAIFCYNDMVAIGVLNACRERGIAVPEELSIVGYDDIKIAGYVSPPLTTIHQPKEELGRIAMQMLLDLLDSRPVQNHVLSPTLVPRASTAPLLRS
jgi:DNA-binding LacI/PurR family transcriptional regulator